MSIFEGWAVSWIPKLAGLIGSVGIVLTNNGEKEWGQLFTIAGFLLAGLSTRQDNKTSEDRKIKSSPAVCEQGAE